MNSNAINNNSSITFDVIGRDGKKIGQITVPRDAATATRVAAVDVQFAMWDLGVAAVKFMSKLVVRDASEGSIAMDVYVKGTRTPSFGLKQNLSAVAFGNVANLYKLETV